jgi:hypothetical protein
MERKVFLFYLIYFCADYQKIGTNSCEPILIWDSASQYWVLSLLIIKKKVVKIKLIEAISVLLLTTGYNIFRSVRYITGLLYDWVLTICG